MQDFRIALVQQDSPVRDKAGNLARTLQWIRKAAKKNAQIVVFPELSVTGHAGCDEMIARAEPVPDGPAVRALMKAAAENGIYVCAGLAEVERGAFYNTQVLVGPDGYVGKQRKVHLSADEYFYFRGGTDMPLFDLPFARVGILVCYDNNVPEVARCLAVRGMELHLATLAARDNPWYRDAAKRRRKVQATKNHWRLELACRAWDNGCYVAVCNAAGRSARGIRGVEANHYGGCMVFDPWGKATAESRSRDVKEEMLVAQIDSKVFERRRRAKCFNLRTRKCELFGPLVEPTA